MLKRQYRLWERPSPARLEKRERLEEEVEMEKLALRQSATRARVSFGWGSFVLPSKIFTFVSSFLFQHAYSPRSTFLFNFRIYPLSVLF